MIQRAILSLGDPDGFFRWLAEQPARVGPGFAVLLLGAFVSMGTSAWMLLGGAVPQSSQFQAMLDQAGISQDVVALALLLSAPPASLVTWLLVWIPIRLGAGTSERVWEVAAWSQLPQLALSLIQTAIVALASVFPAALATGLSVAGLVWCTWFVYTGVRYVARGNGLRAAVLYALFWFALLGFGLIFGPGSASQGSGPLMS